MAHSIPLSTEHNYNNQPVPTATLSPFSCVLARKQFVGQQCRAACTGAWPGRSLVAAATRVEFYRGSRLAFRSISHQYSGPEGKPPGVSCDVAGQSYLTFVAQSFFAASWSSVCLDIRVTLTEIFGDTCNFGPKIYKNLLAQDWSVGIRKNGFSFHCALTIINKERYRVTDQRKVPTKLKCEYRG